MNILPELAVAGFILAFGGIVYLILRTSRRDQAIKDQQISTLGFKAPGAAPIPLQTRVEELYSSRAEGKIVLKQVYQRRELDQDLYLFDIYSTGGEGTELGKEVFGLISSQLALPRFTLMTIPEFDRDSLIGGLMDSLLDRVMALAVKRLGLQRVELSDRPENEDRFIVFGQDPSAVRNFLGRVTLSSLQIGALPLQITGSGDFLTVDFSISGKTSDQKLDLISQYNHFQEIALIFSQSS